MSELGNAADPSWPHALIERFPTLFTDTIGLAGVPEHWRGLLTIWAEELTSAGAIQQGLVVDELKVKYGTLRADLHCARRPDNHWNAFEVSLEDRSGRTCTECGEPCEFDEDAMSSRCAKHPLKHA